MPVIFRYNSSYSSALRSQLQSCTIAVRTTCRKSAGRSRISHSAHVEYARDDAHRDELLATVFKGKKPEIGRFKGLGEMMASQLKETTMDPRKRTLLRVVVVEDERKNTESSVERLMGNKPEMRFEFIQERAEFADEEMLDL